ncbi:MAG TPA: hypothetical protein VFU03_02680 [Gemmatimonadales bacterium]|nr:hypothetical protein [Gemmatimonadales bacterium]
MASGLRLSALLVCTVAGAANAQNLCVDRSGRPISEIVDKSLTSAGGAVLRNGERLILWNQTAASKSSETGQLFLYLHECAHHTLGHVYKSPNLRWELEADCWAFQLLAEGGLVKNRRLIEFERDLAATPGDALHLGGEVLMDSLQRCLTIRTDQQAWASALKSFTTAAQGRFASIRGDPIPDATLGTYESLTDAPGTFDCEVLDPASLRCPLFLSRKDRPARSRYEQLVKIFRRWLPPNWTSIDQRAPWVGSEVPAARRPVRQFLAQDSENGTLLALVLTQQDRVYLVVRSPEGWLASGPAPIHSTAPVAEMRGLLPVTAP